MHTARAALVALVLLSGGCLGFGASLDQSDENATGGVTTESVNTTKVEQEVHRLVNAERTQRGLDALDYNHNLQAVARYHSEDMATNGYFGHTSPTAEGVEDRYTRFNIECSSDYGGGENIAYTYASTPVERTGGPVDYNSNETRIAKGVVGQWMQSDGHRENILRDFASQAIGVETTQTDDGTKIYVTQNFC